MRQPILPSMLGKRSGYVNLDLEARIWILSNPGASLLDPETCQRMVDEIHRKYSIDFSYGGWMEDRTFLWKGGYMDTYEGCVHLGVDINVPAGTEVAASFHGTVVRVDDDHPEPEGWGPRVIIRHEYLPFCVTYAHLNPKINVSAGEEINAGTVIGTVGTPPRNGNWFPHLHAQALSTELFETLSISGNWKGFDGYGSAADLKKLARDFPDPLQFILI